jgi:hypothetical protein
VIMQVYSSGGGSNRVKSLAPGLKLRRQSGSAGELCGGPHRPVPDQPANPGLTNGLPRVLQGAIQAEPTV